jgi:CshA-type fibril repeat protein
VKYIVNDNNDNQLDPANIRIDYEQTLENDDYPKAKSGESVEVKVLENDDDVNRSSVSFVVPTDATGDDTDGDGDIDKVTVPGEGIWTVDENGTVTFTPEPGFTGDPTMQYAAKDAYGNTIAAATITITYMDTGNRPTAVVDTLIVSHYGINSGSVAGNDIAGVGALSDHTYQLITTKFEDRRLEKTVQEEAYDYDNVETIEPGTTIRTENGTVSMKLDGTYIYTPDADYKGPDEFDYVIIDTIGQKDPAAVDITVDCASSQTSDGGGALGMTGVLFMILLTIMTGLYFVRKEDERGEA